MPLQNRVTPFNQIVAYHERGTFMGNRGCLHNDHRTVVRNTCREKRWIICVTSFKDRSRPLMSPGLYTELFFLDEATGLAAGHRPCAECRRADYHRFKQAWIDGSPDSELTVNSTIEPVDKLLHRDRLKADGQQRGYTEQRSSLLSGVFVQIPGDQSAYLLWNGMLLRWSPAGYSDRGACGDQSVNVLTPRCTVNAIRAGYVRVVHSTLQPHESRSATLPPQRRPHDVQCDSASAVNAIPTRGESHCCSAI